MTIHLEMEHAEWLDDDDDWPPPIEPDLGPAARAEPLGVATESVTLGALARLLLGGVTEGSALAAAHLAQWQAATPRSRTGFGDESPDETESERLRYALIGLFAKAPGAAQSALAGALHASDGVYPLVTSLLNPILNRRALRPARRRYDQLAAQGGTMVERWIDVGRSTEQASRALAKQVAVDGTDEAMNQVIGIAAGKPEVRDLISQQSVGMADEMMMVLRQRSAVADARWERRVRALVRRP